MSTFSNQPSSAAEDLSSSSHSPDSNQSNNHCHDGLDDDVLAPFWPKDTTSAPGVVSASAAAHVLADEPMPGDLTEPVSFKRKQKPSALAQPARIASAITGRLLRFGRSSNGAAARSSPEHILLHGLDSHRCNNGHGSGNGSGYRKEGMPLDWYVEGPGRRVGYEDLTAIDWIFEYTKERQRLRVLAGTTQGILGYLTQFVDASQVWMVLILTGLAVGTIAAGIDVVSNWLGDIKTGYCSSGQEGGAFYLNRMFCCYGYEEWSKCLGWRSWGAVLGISSKAGVFIVAYIFFTIFSVR